MSLNAPIVHLELLTNDLPSARSLYGELCGWRSGAVDTGHGSYVAGDLGRGLGGGFVECSAEKPLWLPYVQVADIAAATERAEELGARLLLGPREGPAGWRSVVST